MKHPLGPSRSLRSPPLRDRFGLLGLLAVVPFLLLDPAPVEACGGTFCDTGPTSMPVDQTGENVLFVIDDTHVEAHIQIQYDPEADADKFAWVIPMQVLPEFSVGSEQLFQNLLAGSVPTYGYNTLTQDCGGEAGGDGDGDPGGDGDPTGDGDGDPGPEIIYQDVVGAFEIAVLQGGTIEEVMQWLGDNGYAQDPNAEPILDLYLQEGFLFVALKLAMNTEVAEIHPIVLRYTGDEPCVPLRLTRIAAVEDMDVRVFMLGNARSVPSNYRHVLVNPLKIDWINFAANYKEVISLAVDAFAAEGNAFVTEYAGPSGVVSQGGLYNANWNAAAFAGLQATPELTVDELAAQGLATCFMTGCEFNHAMLQPLFDKYLPVPDMVDPVAFYGCLSCYAGLIDQVAWDAAAFAADLDERIIQPGVHAVDLLDSWSYLTRMFTTISPNEMNIDPIFHENPDLPDVSNINDGTRTLLCNGDAVFFLPDGREVYLPNPNSWPDFQDEMPWEEDVEQAAMVGPNQNLSDRTELIDELLAAWNNQHGWGGDGDGDPSGDGDGDGDGGPTTGGETAGDAGATEEGTASCACSTGSRDATGAFAMLALLGLGWRLRRRARV
jgi:MYXO-CTERM domain-containing protein